MNVILACTAFAVGVASPGPSDAAQRANRAGERRVNAVLAGVFAYAGVRMLPASQTR